MGHRTPDLTLGDLTLDAVAPTDEVALREWFELKREARAVDLPHDPPPCWVDLRAALLAPEPGTRESLWLARRGGTADGAVVGAAYLGLPTLDNVQNAVAYQLLVAPAARRRGIGRRLLAHLCEYARDAGRVRLSLEAQEPLDAPGPGAAFLAWAGAELGQADTRRRLTLAELDSSELERLAADARAAATGYGLVSWTGATPDRWLDDIAALLGRMSTDAPHGDLHVEPARWDARRVRDRDDAIAARGLSHVTTAARGPDGTLVAFTEIMRTTSVRWHADQADTIVAPAHRGHRLGMLIKLANLARTRAELPEVEMIDTYNADSNAHMLAINVAMGFRPVDRVGEWELDLDLELELELEL